MNGLTAENNASDRGCRPSEPKVPALDPHELLVRNVVDYVIYMLDPGGRVVSWNPGAESIISGIM
jgi:hypothetical protein